MRPSMIDPAKTIDPAAAEILVGDAQYLVAHNCPERPALP